MLPAIRSAAGSEQRKQRRRCAIGADGMTIGGHPGKATYHTPHVDMGKPYLVSKMGRRCESASHRTPLAHATSFQVPLKARNWYQRLTPGQWVHSRLGSVSITSIATPKCERQNAASPHSLNSATGPSVESSQNPSQCCLSLKSSLSRETFRGTLSH